jgi:tetratricopeptide (TPR) repeat protein
MNRKVQFLSIFCGLAIFSGLAFAQSAYDLGTDAKIEGDFETALKHFSQAIKDNPKDALSYMMRADVYSELQDYKSAIADYTAVIKLTPDDAAAYNNRATVYGQSGDLKNAEKDARKACEMKVCNTLNFMDKNGMLGK